MRASRVNPRDESKYEKLMVQMKLDEIEKSNYFFTLLK